MNNDWLESYEAEEFSKTTQLSEQVLNQKELDVRFLYEDKVEFKDVFSYSLHVLHMINNHPLLGAAML